MRIHKARGALYDIDRERQWNWWKATATTTKNSPWVTWKPEAIFAYCVATGQECAESVLAQLTPATQAAIIADARA